MSSIGTRARARDSGATLPWDPEELRALVVTPGGLQAEALRQRLELDGYDVAMAAPDDVWWGVREHTPDLVFVDRTRAPASAGHVLRALEADDRGRRLPVVCLDLHSDAFDRDAVRVSYTLSSPALPALERAEGPP